MFPAGFMSHWYSKCVSKLEEYDMSMIVMLNAVYEKCDYLKYNSCF